MRSRTSQQSSFLCSVLMSAFSGRNTTKYKTSFPPTSITSMSHSHAKDSSPIFSSGNSISKSKSTQKKSSSRMESSKDTSSK
jgi:hypothetical protein